MFDTNTQYALNKRNPKAIVYIDAFGKKTELSADVLGKEDFSKWKAIMDESLHKQELEDHIYHDHTISFGDISLAEYAVPDYETILIEAEEHREREELKAQLGVAFFTCLSDIQQARLWLYAIEGMTTYQISDIEGSTRQAVCASLNKARKNILNFFEKGGCQNSVFAAYSEGVIN